jgi:hypothetical protein
MRCTTGSPRHPFLVGPTANGVYNANGRYHGQIVEFPQAVGRISNDPSWTNVSEGCVF